MVLINCEQEIFKDPTNQLASRDRFEIVDPTKPAAHTVHSVEGSDPTKPAAARSARSVSRDRIL